MSNQAAQWRQSRRATIVIDEPAYGFLDAAELSPVGSPNDHYRSLEERHEADVGRGPVFHAATGSLDHPSQSTETFTPSESS